MLEKCEEERDGVGDEGRSFLIEESQVLANRKTRNDERFVRSASIKLHRENLDIANVTPSNADGERKFIAIL